MSRPVMRLGATRVCLVIPCATDAREVLTMRNQDAWSCLPGDDAVNGMGLYETKGAVATWCGQLALFDLQGDADLTVDCLGCIANERKL